MKRSLGLWWEGMLWHMPDDGIGTQGNENFAEDRMKTGPRNGEEGVLTARAGTLMQAITGTLEGATNEKIRNGVTPLSRGGGK